MSAFDVLKRRPDGTQRIERPEYYVQVGSMFENPYGVPHEEIIRMIEENAAETSAQTVFGKYVESSGLVFTGELIQMLFDRDTTGVRSQTYLDRSAAARAAHVWKRKKWLGDYHTGVDFARQTDFTVITTICTRPLPARVVYWKRLNRVSWDSIFAEVGRARHLFGPNILCDGTGPGGDVAMDQLTSREYCPKHHRVNVTGSVCMDNGERMDCKREEYRDLSVCDDYDFNGARKKELVEHLRNVLSVGQKGSPDDFGWLRSPPIPQLEEELTFYAWDDKRLMTDCLFSLALAAWSGLEDVPGEAFVGSPFGQ